VFCELIDPTDIQSRLSVLVYVIVTRDYSVSPRLISEYGFDIMVDICMDLL